MVIVIEILLGLAVVVAAVGYWRSSDYVSGSREEMPALLAMIVLALGFLGLLLK